MVDIKEKFGTDWISGGSISRAARPQTKDDIASLPGVRGGRETNPAFVTIGKRIVRLLADMEGVARLYNVADRMQMEPADLAPVAEWMAKSYYIRVEPDTYGNHLMQLTGRAKELLEK
ncbi:MAG TPA: hypothetical protein VF544_01855 [Pyrinomonadaceae bacterium]|jgi:hypothetical protein